MQTVCQTVWLLQDTVYLIEAKRQNMFWDTHYIPEAVGQGYRTSGVWKVCQPCLFTSWLRLPPRIAFPSQTSNGSFLSNGWAKLDFLLHLEVKRWETDILSLLMHNLSDCQSNRLSMSKAVFEGSDLPVVLSEIMQLLCEWVTFSVGDISLLEDCFSWNDIKFFS